MIQFLIPILAAMAGSAVKSAMTPGAAPQTQVSPQTNFGNAETFKSLLNPFDNQTMDMPDVSTFNPPQGTNVKEPQQQNPFANIMGAGLGTGMNQGLASLFGGGSGGGSAIPSTTQAVGNAFGADQTEQLVSQIAQNAPSIAELLGLF
jgi:hypothetical protein